MAETNYDRSDEIIRKWRVECQRVQERTKELAAKLSSMTETERRKFLGVPDVIDWTKNDRAE